MLLTHAPTVPSLTDRRCLEEAAQLSSLKPELDAAGVGLHAVVHHATNIEKFQKQWHGQEGTILLDEGRAFFKALGEKWGSLLSLMSPSFISKYRAAQKTVDGDGDAKGEGRLLGGVLVVRQGQGGVAWQHKESTFGDRAEPQAVLDAVRRLSQAESKSTAEASAPQ